MDRWELMSTRSWQKRETKRRTRGIWYDNIFCFDTETTSAFITPEGDIIAYDYSKPEEFYTRCEKIGFMYIWMFSIDDHVFYGRTWEELRSFLKELNAIFPEHKIVYVHNLAFDFQFLRNLFYEWDSVFCRNKRKVLTADRDTLHFRCSYLLTNKSLAQWAKSENLPVTKATGQLNYNVIRTPLSDLSETDLDYCERDLLVMYYGLCKYRDNKYKHVYSIPLTQTGEVRAELSKVMVKEYGWRRKMAKLMPDNLKDYNYLMAAFFGGDTHANYIHSGETLRNVKSSDISSDYPWQMISKQYPLTSWADVRSGAERFFNNAHYSYIVTFEVYNFKSKLYNTFLSRSRCREIKGARCDNGRVLEASYAVITFTNIDFELFREFYEYQRLDILRFSVSINNYLNPKYCKYILELYRKKTELKGVKGAEDEYRRSKALLNSIYGDSVTRDFTAEIVFNNETFESIPPTEEYFKRTYESKQKRKDRLYKSVNIGIFVTAYARAALWNIIKQLDYQTVYFDTDSVKYIGNDRGVISSYNIGVMLEHYKIARRLGVPLSALAPADPNGKTYPIGTMSFEPSLPTGYTEFRTLGAKKYCLRDRPGDPIEITIAGVPKKNAAKLKSVEDLSDDLIFTPAECGKSISFYCDNQEPVTINGWEMSDRFGICLQPTGYRVGLSLDYMLLLAENRDAHRHDLDIWDEILGG